MTARSAPKKRIIVVLGMHRSGTSAITRGLIALGAETGDYLMPPVAGVNDKGFWEDQEFNTINIAVLHALGHDWHTLTPIRDEELAATSLSPLRLRALNFLRERLAEHPVFAMKDPRAARLLPFWQELFSRIDADVSYVIAVRHPTSVARSLETRDGVATEKSYYLWLEHLVASYLHTTDAHRIVIDYDRLMDHPGTEMARLSRGLDLAVEPGAGDNLDSFISQFLEDTLRHTRFSKDDLNLDPSANTLLLDMYCCLQEVAADRLSLDDAAVRSLMERGNATLVSAYSLLKLANSLEMQLYAARDLAQRSSDAATEQRQARELGDTALEESVRNHQQSLHRISELENAQQTDREQQSLLSTLVQDQRRDLEAANQALIARSAFVEQLQQQLLATAPRLQQLQHEHALATAALEETIRRQQQDIDAREATANGQSALIRELEQLAADRANHINMMNCDQDVHLSDLASTRESLRYLESKLSESDSERRRLSVALNETRASHSWRITAPLRVAANVIRAEKRRVRRQVSSLIRRIYRALPLSTDNKVQLKSTLFSSCGFLLADSITYKQWKASQDYYLLASSRPPSPATNTPQIGSLSAAIIANDLFTADGTTEWMDYAVTRDRIRAMDHAQRNAQKFVAFDLIDIDDRNLIKAARKIRMPAVESPMVSIVVPVYNQLKYTLECLASIVQHSGSATTYEVIVADDASTDETAEALAGIENLRVSGNAANLGFLRNCNAASKLARGRYIVFLNNDVQVTEGWLDALVGVFRQSSGVGAVGPRIVYPSGHLQEAGVSFKRDGTTQMIGLADSPHAPQYNYQRDVDYCSGACLLLETKLFHELGGFDDRFAPAYCEDSDLCLQIHERGLRVIYCPQATVVHHLSKTSDALGQDFKLQCIGKNIEKLTDKWQPVLDRRDDVRVLAFYLPQFHPIPENDFWWGKGFTEWANVTKARPNFVGHYQPREPADLGYYDLRIPDVMRQQAALAQRYGIDGFCFYYYWFNGKRLLEQPLEHLLGDDAVEMPFCLCWANENWTRRWDGRDSEVLMAQNHSPEDDLAVIADLMRYFRSPNYIRVNGKPLVIVYRVTLFPDFQKTAAIWRNACLEAGLGEIHLTMVESFELVHKGVPPSEYGCDAALEFPPQELAEVRPPGGDIVNPEFNGLVADYRDLAVRYATRPNPGYCRFRGVTPGWDNTARRQNNSFCFEHATPGSFQAWLETAVEKTRNELSGDERMIFINAWNEWAEGAYLEPDRRFGHTFLEAVKNARDSAHLQRIDKYMLGS